MREGPFPPDVPARLDRLRWSSFHTSLIAALGTSWIIDGLEVTLVGSLAGALTLPTGLGLSASEVGEAAGAYVAGAVIGAILFGGFEIPLRGLRVILHHAFALVVATTEFHLGLCVACFCLRLHFLNRFLIGLGLLRGQLNDSDTRRQQKREYQPTRFHIGKLIRFQHAC